MDTDGQKKTCIGNGNTRNVYVLNNVNLNIVDSIKDLSVIVASDLSGPINVSEVVKKANKITNAILHAFCSHDINLYIRAFNVYISPLIKYCCYVWLPSLCCDIDLIENLQRTFTS